MEWIEVWDKFVDVVNGGMEGVNRGLMAVFGNHNEREVRKLRARVDAINALEPILKEYSEETLKNQTKKLRDRFAAGESLDDLIVDAFATTREAGRRYLKMRHYDVQLLGGMILHSGRIAEMVTGEGKTLVATLAAYLNAIAGKGVHVVTVNDYLARRDAEWMSPLFNGLGMTVGAIQSNMDPQERRYHYHCDITYGTNNEFGFDYLRDNMKPTKELQAQRGLHYAIIDEVDSILIDEARTPLIISGPAFDDPMKYTLANRIAQQLKRDIHFEVKEKEHTCHLTDAGVLEAEKLANVESFYTAGHMEWPHLIDNALKANYLYKRDKDYMVRSGEVIIIDEHTGRAMEGRQWSDGLHQAVEAKENVKIKEETQTLATITFQNFFKLYKKIAGMTGTAMTEANEFYKIYGLDVIAAPTNKPLARVNHPDVIFCTEKEKWTAVLEEVQEVHATGRPVLVGTTSVEKSEFLSNVFRRHGIDHEVLNAKFVEREAEIVAQAGRRGAVTIATNMAGRGTDIILGGNPEFKAWAELKDKYPTRLEVPPEVWEAAVAPHRGPMKEEGRELIQKRTALEIAREMELPNAEKLAEVLEKASFRQLEDPHKLCANNGITDVDSFLKLMARYKAAHPGGLHIIGTERHESRRIDNQLRGRSGRQGDPGSSRFYLSLEDDLMRIFAGDWVKGILQRLGMKDGEAIESGMVSRRIEGAQKKVEERHFDSRKNLLEYDEIMDVQRKRVYGFRQEVLDGADCKDRILEMIANQINKKTSEILAENFPAIAFAAWATRKLGVELEARSFNRCDYPEAERIAREEALRQAESSIVEEVDRSLDNDVDKSEWNWEDLTSFANRRWNLKLKTYDLKRIGRDDLGEYLYEQAKKAINDVELDGAKEVFDEDFGRRNVVEWVNQKFAMGITLEELPKCDQFDPGPVAKYLIDKARATYDRKEVEFPVHLGMARFMPEKTGQNNSPRYDRDGLIAWANQRFAGNLNVEDYRNESRSVVQSAIQGLSERFFDNGRFRQRIEEQLEKYFPARKGKNAEVSADTLGELSNWAEKEFGSKLTFETPLVNRDVVHHQLIELAERRYRPEMRETERVLVLQFLDMSWKDHLYAMDHLRSGIGLVGYAQIDPKVEYKRKGRALFGEMWDGFENRVTDLIFRVEETDSNFVSSIWHVTNAVHEQYVPQMEPEVAGGIRGEQEEAIANSQGEQKTETIRNEGVKIGRNDPCWCGSGKKYKNCHMLRKVRPTG